MALSQTVYQVRNPICKKGKEYITLFTLLLFVISPGHTILLPSFCYCLTNLFSSSWSCSLFKSSMCFTSKPMTFTSPLNSLPITWNLTFSKLNWKLFLLPFLPLAQNTVTLSLSQVSYVLKLGIFPPFPSSFLVPLWTNTGPKLVSGWVLSSTTSPLTSLKQNWVQGGAMGRWQKKASHVRPVLRRSLEPHFLV